MHMVEVDRVIATLKSKGILSEILFLTETKKEHKGYILTKEGMELNKLLRIEEFEPTL